MSRHGPTRGAYGGSFTASPIFSEGAKNLDGLAASAGPGVSEVLSLAAPRLVRKRRAESHA